MTQDSVSCLHSPFFRISDLAASENDPFKRQGCASLVTPRVGKPSPAYPYDFIFCFLLLDLYWTSSKDWKSIMYQDGLSTVTLLSDAAGSLHLGCTCCVRLSQSSDYQVTFYYHYMLLTSCNNHSIRL